MSGEMNSLKFSATTHFVILSLLGLLSFASEAVFIDSFCSNTSHFEPNSTFQSNLNILLSSLTSNVSLHDGFFNTTAGQQGTPYSVSGLFLCRGDVTDVVCQDCVTTAAKEITRRCPKDTQSIIWYDDCMLRYSNDTFDITVPIINIHSNKSIADADQGRFSQLLASLLKDLAEKVVNSPTSEKKFATGEENFMTSQTLYGLAQCTPDMPVFDCNMCLQSAISSFPNCCDGRQGARALLPGCNIRYELYPFYNITTSSPTPVVPSRSGGIQILLVIAIIVPIVAVALFVLGCCFLRKRASKKKSNTAMDDEIDLTDVESLHFDLATIEDATNRFSDEMKIGQGGFGVVYRGIIPNRREIAVKRLSVTSSQGALEFKNEAVIVAKLQHRNLARLLGFCLEGQEKILIYEYIPNKSLDHFLFDPEKRRELDWSTRYKIIVGITRGILYLHEDSRLKIIHRDLKASNILLDANMNPKISDFGMAKTFGVNETELNTRRIAGTYGYMSPEYAMHGQYSTKSDVFSFGVLMLEIVSGRKNTEFYQSQHADDLLSYAWKNWTKQTPLELLDPTVRDSYSRNEVMRCIQIGLLCVQENPADRPSMANIVLVLNSYSVTLQLPRRPAYFLRGRTPNKLGNDLESDQSSASSAILRSVNDSSITQVYPR